MDSRFQDAWQRHAKVAADQMGVTAQINGKPLTVVLMPVERTDPRVEGGFLDGVMTQAFAAADDWAGAGGALSQVITLPSGAKGRVAKLTVQEGGVLLDIAPENQRPGSG